MRLSEYQEKSKRTLNSELPKAGQLHNMIYGIVGETGEVVDEIKKHCYQGHELNVKHIREELGDVMFYIVNLCNVLDMELEEIISENYDKLLKRYPNGFEIKRSVNRE